MHDPIVILISSFREDELIQGAIRSVLPLDAPILVYEGPTTPTPPLGVGGKTSLGRMKDEVATFYRAEWMSEADKRNAMLAEARERMGGRPFWIHTLDADEILVWSEYLPDWLNALKPGHPRSVENVAPLKVTVPGVDEYTKNGLATYIQPSRLVHSSFLDHYEVGLVYARSPEGSALDFSAYRSEIPPAYGEPHIHHRYYLRRGKQRRALRGTDLEAQELKKHGLQGRTIEESETK